MQQIGHHILATWYSTNYNYRALFQYDVKQESYIMGQQMSSLHDVQRVVLNTIRFTYREGFQQLKCGEGNLTTDSGWGCMIRVGQMMMAEILKRHLKCFYGVDVLLSQPLLRELLEQFNDNDENESLWNMFNSQRFGFSIQKIIRVAQKQWNKKPGEWYSPNQIVQAIDIILSEHNIKFCYGLRFIPCYESQIDLKLLIQEMCMTQNCTCQRKCFDIKKLLQCLNKLIIHVPEEVEVMHENNEMRKLSYSDFTEQEKEQILQMIRECVCEQCFEVKRAVSLCLLSRIGCDEPNPDYIAVIRQFMKKSYFAGMLGGRPKQANFIVGFVDDKFVVLDPHLVQESRLSPDEYIKSCFPKEVMFMGENEIDCSLGMVFYLSDKSDLVNFIYDVQSLKQNSFFSFGSNMQGTYSGIKDDKKQIDELQNYLMQHQVQIVNLEASTYEIHQDLDSSYEQI